MLTGMTLLKGRGQLIVTMVGNLIFMLYSMVARSSSTLFRHVWSEWTMLDDYN